MMILMIKVMDDKRMMIWRMLKIQTVRHREELVGVQQCRSRRHVVGGRRSGLRQQHESDRGF